MKNMRDIFNKIKEKENRWFFLSVLIFGILLGLVFSGIGGSADSEEGQKGLISDNQDHSEGEIWTCSMHPQIRKPKAGQCPLCGMDLIPVETDNGEMGARELKLSPHAVKLAEIETSVVQRRVVSSMVWLSGKVKVDETRVKFIASRIPGRIERLFADFTGARVRKGEPLVLLYSPDLITAQQELIQTVLYSSVSRNKEWVQAVKKKLHLWGVTNTQIKKIISSGEPEEHLTIFSPYTGTIINKNAAEGIYVATGERIYTIADLSKLWVVMDAYESDLQWIRRDMNVKFETEAYPGEFFASRIIFIDPVIDPRTRTVRVRAEVDNREQKLKPDMFVRAVVESNLNSGHRGRGDLVIPITAPLITGSRAVAYVESKDKESVFEGREVVLGPKAGDYYIVKNGLSEGEKVVVNGAFKIDSDLQIQAKPSMMNPSGLKLEQREKIPEKFRASIDRIGEIYFRIQEDLSRDKTDGVNGSGKSLAENLDKIDMNLLKGDSHMEWMKIGKILRSGAEELMGAKDIESARKALEIITGPTLNVLKYFGSREKTYFRMHCPMAFDNKGAFWLQKDENTRNPYFGESMLTCKDSMEEVSTGKRK